MCLRTLSEQSSSTTRTGMDCKGNKRHDGRIIYNPYETTSSSPLSPSKQPNRTAAFSLCSSILFMFSFVFYFGYYSFSEPSSLPYNESYHYEEVVGNFVDSDNKAEHGFGVPDLEEVWGFDEPRRRRKNNLRKNSNNGGGLRGSGPATATASATVASTPKKTTTKKTVQKLNEFQPRPIVIAGPSGVGKGTLINKILEKYNAIQETDNYKKDYFGFSVSHTTRQPRPGEVNGTHYHYTTMENMQQMVTQDAFVEYATVHGNMYGTSYEAVQSVTSSGRICILDIDVQGVKNIKEKITASESKNSNETPKPYFIFIAPPSMEILEQRLRDRKTESEEAILKRTANAAKEVEYGTKGNNFDAVIVNDDLEKAFGDLSRTLEGWYPHLSDAGK